MGEETVALSVELMGMRPFCKEIPRDLHKSCEMDDQHMLHSGNDRGTDSSGIVQVITTGQHLCKPMTQSAREMYGAREWNKLCTILGLSHLHFALSQR